MVHYLGCLRGLCKPELLLEAYACIDPKFGKLPAVNSQSKRSAAESCVVISPVLQGSKAPKRGVFRVPQAHLRMESAGVWG